MNEQEMMTRILTAFPDAYVDEDNEGQVVVYTNLWRQQDGTYTAENYSQGV